MFGKVLLLLFFTSCNKLIPLEAKRLLSRYTTPSSPIPQKYLTEFNEVLPVSANYGFSYSIYNDRTGDIKSHEVTRKKDEVHGTYTLIDSDGYKRIVEYRANDREGFVARVRREPTYFRVPTYKNIVSQSLLPSRAFYNVEYISPNTNYKYAH